MEYFDDGGLEDLLDDWRPGRGGSDEENDLDQVAEFGELDFEHGE